MLKSFPDFDEKGDLPDTVYQATLTEIIEHFGEGTLQRQIVARRLSRIYELAKSTGELARFIIFGSFVTNKPSPKDVDIFMIMEDTFEFDKLVGETAIIFNHMLAQNWEGASIFWIRRLAAIGGEQAAIEHWQIKRDGGKRGIIEVIGND
ncbi:MAG: hypothetical protein AB1757_16600 [Acidobacteriota bacterium]